MTDTTSDTSTRRGHRRRDAVALTAAVSVAATATAAGTLPYGPAAALLCAAGLAARPAVAALRARWSRRRDPAPPPSDTGAAAPTDAPGAPAPAAQSALWRMRTTVQDAPGSLAALCTALAAHRVDILSLQTHPLSAGTADEFLLRAPGTLSPQELTGAVAGAGGRSTWLERADTHDLVDAPARMLGLATRTALDSAELPLALRQLLGRCTIRSVPARPLRGRPAEPLPAEGVLEEHSMKFRDASGGSLIVERPQLPFTPTEFARVHALVELDRRLGQRVPHRREVLTLPEGNDLTIRRAGPDDLAAAVAMHGRCSAATLARRYHGPVGDADAYLRHLLGPHHGRTLAVETASGRLVALGHLLWDGDETEVALLIEDAWQRRGIGADLLRRLVAMADEVGCGSVYAITQASNTGMVAAMRGLGLPLDYQIEDGTLVITTRPQGEPATRATRSATASGESPGLG
ncbi:GNAT family N-acetyltransferase [Streptomyces catenulae]|uniref:GNAT family N-acetyltransferase n=1 Tax=Streptomyces catenulae TaxID=66875 RepID=A0ABV2Z748_9ACTN|nr:GNAT family N-acetyltransferase [Streptomyces catenulae]